MPKSVLWMVVGIISAATCAVVALSIGTAGATPLSIGTFVTTALTFIALVFYARDNNRLARITQDKWENETILDTTYEMTIDPMISDN